jgi:hypothetical protein
MGSIVGAFATYRVNKLTDKRRKKEATQELQKEFLDAKQQMPELIAEIKNDLLQEGNSLIREFFISKRSYTLNVSDICFVYFEDDHPDLQSKVHILESHGYIIDITPGNAPKYRMTEEFVKFVVST